MAHQRAIGIGDAMSQPDLPAVLRDIVGLPLARPPKEAVSLPGWTIRAMAGALGERAELLTFRTDQTWCRERAHDLDLFGRQLPTQDGGEDVERAAQPAPPIVRRAP